MPPYRAGTRTHQGVGLVQPVDGVFHAVSSRFGRLTAVCGAGRITTLVLGQFDPNDRHACAACRDKLEGRPT
jgi:hypothetical protein